MRNLYIVFIIGLFIISGVRAEKLFAVAEVSKKNEIAVFPVYSAYEIPDSAHQYFDDKLIGLLSGMKRFQVIGYQYHLDNRSADEFIKKIQELKKEAIVTNPQYIDADLGITVIPAAEMQKLVNAFFIFMPSINGYSVEEYQVEVKETRSDGKIVIRLVKEYKVNVNISVKIITAEGNLLDTYNASSAQTSRTSSIDAYQKGVDDAISGLGFFLRNVEEFKIKTQVLEINPKGVYIELGKDLGVRPGYEFAIQKETKILNKFTEKVNTGILRVKEIGEQWSVASTIFGKPEVGDQLLELPMLGGRFNVFAGALPMAVTGKNFTIISSTSDSKTVFTNSGTMSPSSYVPTFGIEGEYELGYAGLVDLSGGILFNNPFAFYGQLGGGYEFYLWNMSFVIGADLSIIGLSESLGVINNSSQITINNTSFSNNISVDLSGVTVGIKPRLSFSYQFNQRMKLRITGGYALYLLPNFSITYTDSSDSKNTTSVSVGTTSVVNLTVDGNTQSTLPVNFSGPFGEMELVFRF